MASSSTSRVIGLVSLAAACVVVAIASYQLVNLWIDRAPDGPVAAASQLDMKDLEQAAIALRACALPDANKGDCSPETSLLSHLVKGKGVRQFAIGKPGDLFDILLLESMLVLTKKDCSSKQYADHHMGWSAWSKSKAPKTEGEEKSGQYGAFYAVNQDLKQSGTDCAIVMPLPLPRSDVKRVYLGMLKPDKSDAVWKNDIVLDGVASARKP